jgi:hypothetical protein
MKKLIIAALALILMQSTASAAPGTASGPSALALAAVIAQHSPAVRAFDKRVIARLFRGNTNFGFTPQHENSRRCGFRNLPREQRGYHVAQLRAQLRSAQTHADRARSQRSRRNDGSRGHPFRGSRGLEHRKRLQVAVHDRPQRNHAEGGRRRAVQF